MPRVVDPYLSRIARKAWPRANVTLSVEEVAGTEYRSDYKLEREGTAPVELALAFHDARERLRTLASTAAPPPNEGTP